MNRPHSAPWAMVSMARAIYGALLVAFPAPALAALSGAAPSRRERELARLLGARHLLQAAASAWAGQGAAFPGAVVDGLHAASMLAVATAEPRLRRACLADAALESLLASTGIALAASAIRSCPAAGT